MARQSKFFAIPDEPAPIFEGYSQETFKFLHGLKKNNNKEWFEKHRDEYEIFLRTPSKALAYTMGRHFKDNRMPLIGNAKTSLFRINRDIRFSKDKSPYKTHIGLSFPLEGTKKEEWCGFYFSFEPAAKGKGITSFIGGGVYMPMAPYLKRIRTKIDSKHKELKKAIEAESFQEVYPEGLHGESLKRPPIGYNEDNPAIEWLKMKSYIFGSALTEADLCNEDLPQIIIAKFKVAMPVVLFLGTAK